jgi:hypothetical protein
LMCKTIDINQFESLNVTRPSVPRFVIAKSIHLGEELRVPQRDGGQFPTRLRDAALKNRRIAKLRSTLSQLNRELLQLLNS